MNENILIEEYADDQLADYLLMEDKDPRSVISYKQCWGKCARCNENIWWDSKLNRFTHRCYAEKQKIYAKPKVTSTLHTLQEVQPGIRSSSE